MALAIRAKLIVIIQKNIIKSMKLITVVADNMPNGKAKNVLVDFLTNLHRKIK
jgi:hypothetical protein